MQISGAKSESFLQGQLTCDVRLINETHASLAAHCNPKGRIISLFELFKAGGDFYLRMPADLAPIAQQNLEKYAVFSKTNVAIVKPNDCPLLPLASTQAERIQAGIPTVYAASSGLFLPHDLNLPQLGAVSFDKGCYTGQEIIARMQYLGKPKQQLYKAVLSADTVPSPGQILYLASDPDKEMGAVVDAIVIDDKIQLLASLKTELVAEQTEVKTQLGMLCLSPTALIS